MKTWLPQRVPYKAQGKYFAFFHLVRTLCAADFVRQNRGNSTLEWNHENNGDAATEGNRKRCHSYREIMMRTYLTCANLLNGQKSGLVVLATSHNEEICQCDESSQQNFTASDAEDVHVWP